VASSGKLFIQMYMKIQWLFGNFKWDRYKNGKSHNFRHAMGVSFRMEQRHRYLELLGYDLELDTGRLFNGARVTLGNFLFYEDYYLTE
jgi:hypothetical protein